MTTESSAPTGFKGSLRQSMSWLHTWAGLLLGVLLYFMFVSGTAGYFSNEITRWMEGVPVPEVAHPETIPEAEMISRGLALLREHVPEASYWGMRMPHESHAETGLMNVFGTPMDENAEEFNVLMDPLTGEIVEVEGARETGGGEALYVMHYELHYMGLDLAMYLVGIATMFMLVAITSGIIVHKKFFADMFTFRPGKGQRSWLDAHNLTSVLSLPFMVMITYTGLILFAYDYMPAVVGGVYGQGDEAVEELYHEIQDVNGYHDTYSTTPVGTPAEMVNHAPIVDRIVAEWGPGQIGWFEIMNPTDANGEISIWKRSSQAHGYYDIKFFNTATGEERVMDWQTRTANDVTDVASYFHYGMYGGAAMRWLYFFAGLAGTAMIGTGMILWTVKRRQALRGDARAHFGIRFVERLNAGVIIGLPIGVAVYFWANRLIPVGMENRAAWEMNALFIAWGVMLLHAALRPKASVWIEQLGLAAILFMGIPVLNAFTSQIHLGHTIPLGDWVDAGFDLTMIGLGLFFFAAMQKLRGRRDALPLSNEDMDAMMEPAQ